VVGVAHAHGRGVRGHPRRRQGGYRREGSLGAVFAGIYLDSTLRRIDRDDAERLSEVVAAIRSGGPVDEVLARFRREGMSREEADVLERSARELSRVDELFRLYVAPQLAASLQRQPERARLGGEEREVSVLFADLAGFTGFSEARPASDVVEMLNRYWATAVPAVVDEGGLIDRSFTVIGDTINLAARLQSTAPPGEVVIGPTTREDLGDRATVIPLGEAQLKGKREPVPIYRLVSVDGEMTRG
jgi:class 3 adenylate cyclase